MLGCRLSSQAGVRHRKAALSDFLCIFQGIKGDYDYKRILKALKKGKFSVVFGPSALFVALPVCVSLRLSVLQQLSRQLTLT